MSKLKKEKYKKAVDKKCNYMAWYRFLYGFCFIPMKLLFPGKALGREHLPEGTGYILAFNHRSGKDIPLSFYAVPGFRHFVSKEEHYNHALFRWLFPRLGVIAVDREKPDLSTIRKVANVLRNGEVLGIFPEGTRNRDDSAEMLQFKSGTALFALQNKVPVIPVYTYRKPRLFRKNYVYIGEPVDPSKYGAGPINAEKIAACGSDIREALDAAKVRLCEIMDKKSYRKEFKAEKKRLKTKKKQEKQREKEEKKAAKQNRSNAEKK